MKRFYYYGIFLLLFTACTVPDLRGEDTAVSLQTPVVLPNTTATPIPIHAISPTLESPSTITSTSIPTLVPAPQIEMIEPPIEYLCPTQWEGLAELLESTKLPGIIVAPDYDSLGWWFLYTDMTINEVQIDAPDGEEFYSFGSVSPDGQWVAFSTLDEAENKKMWISTFDSQEQILVIEDYVGVSHLWMQDGTIMKIIMPPGSRFDGASVVEQINPSTGSATPLEPIYLYLPGTYAFSPDGTQSVHFIENPYSWVLRDIYTATEQNIFPWMKKDLIDDIGFYGGVLHTLVKWTDAGVSVVRQYQDYIELVFDVPLDLLAETPELVQKVILPSEDILWVVRWWSEDNHFLIIDRHISTEGFVTLPAYTLDTSRWVMYDYCLGDNNPSTVISSPDDRFIAWNAIRDDEFGIIVMEVETGRRAWVTDWVLKAWVNIEQ